MSYHTFMNTPDDEPRGCFEVFYDDADMAHGHARNFDANGEPVAPGWYWWACFPGCLPDGEANGPFASEQDAIDDAQNA